MEKVKLPREVAEALKVIKDRHYTWNNHDLFYIIVNRQGYCQYKDEAEIRLVHDWSQTREFTFATALLNGYEGEQTPEDKVREQYERPRHFVNKDEDTDVDVYRKGIKFALDTFNIKVEGVNDNE